MIDLLDPLPEEVVHWMAAVGKHVWPEVSVGFHQYTFGQWFGVEMRMWLAGMGRAVGFRAMCLFPLPR